MLSLLLGLSLSLHLFAYQATEQAFTQTLTPVYVDGFVPVRVVWTWGSTSQS